MNNDNYEDIIDLQHYEPKHKRMSIEIRSAQFSPFAALTGFNDEIKETERLVDKRILLDEDEKEKINNVLQKVLKSIKNNPEVTITYFIPDNKKCGGKYVTNTNYVKKIDMIEKYIMLKNKIKIYFKYIIDIKIKT